MMALLLNVAFYLASRLYGKRPRDTGFQPRLWCWGWELTARASCCASHSIDSTFRAKTCSGTIADVGQRHHTARAAGFVLIAQSHEIQSTHMPDVPFRIMPALQLVGNLCEDCTAGRFALLDLVTPDDSLAAPVSKE